MPFAAATAQGLPRVRPLQGQRSREARRLHRGAAVAAVAVDTLGADRGVAEVVAGAVESAAGSSLGHAGRILFGPLDQVSAAAGDPLPAGVELVDAQDFIANDEEAARAVRARPEASIVVAAEAVASGRAAALVSAGSTGAALAASLLRIKRIPGVYRPAVAAQLPLPGRQVLLLDVGANTEVRPEHLVQFAYMGAAFCEGVLGVERPEVGLLSVGEEQGKGTPEIVAAYEQLAGASSINFVGNIEGDGVTAGGADVVVTGGFAGNIALKTMEGTFRAVTGAIRDRISSGTASKLGGLLIRSRMRGLRAQLDPETVGGAYLLGLRSPVVICHGSSSRRAIANAIALAERGVTENVVGAIEQSLQSAGVVRGGGSATSDSATRPSVLADSVEVH